MSLTTFINFLRESLYAARFIQEFIIWEIDFLKFCDKCIDCVVLNPVQDGPFWGCSLMGGEKDPVTKICDTYPTTMVLAQLYFT